MKNDYKGIILTDKWSETVTFYASGQSGKEVRADGKGGALERGYYANSRFTATTGPFTTRNKASENMRRNLLRDKTEWGT